MKYDKSQIGWLLIGVFVLIIISISVAYIWQVGERPLTENAYYALVSILICLLLLLYKLRVRVDENGIHVIYGIGLIKFRFNPEKINDVRAVKSSMLYGWGIRIIPGGILYNIQGTKTVEISYWKKKNKIIRIGTTDEDNLIKAIKERYNLL